MSTGESFESRFEKIDVTLKDPKSEVNVDCLLVSRGPRGPVSSDFLPRGTASRTPGRVTRPLRSALCLLGAERGVPARPRLGLLIPLPRPPPPLAGGAEPAFGSPAGERNAANSFGRTIPPPTT